MDLRVITPETCIPTPTLSLELPSYIRTKMEAKTVRLQNTQLSATSQYHICRHMKKIRLRRKELFKQSLVRGMQKKENRRENEDTPDNSIVKKMKRIEQQSRSQRLMQDRELSEDGWELAAFV